MRHVPYAKVAIMEWWQLLPEYPVLTTLHNRGWRSQGE